MTRKCYERLSDGLTEDGAPKTPCRNVPGRPCVVVATGSNRFATTECMSYECVRVKDDYKPGSMPHRWVKDEDGGVEYFEFGGYHGGPQCIRCKEVFCQHCDPEKWTELCDLQDAELF